MLHRLLMQTQLPRWFGFALLSAYCVFTTAHVSAQVYKWTDAQGKVHYSDKKIADSAQAQDLNLGTMPSAKAVETLAPKHYSGTVPALYFLLNEPNIEDSRTILTRPKFAYFYFGGDCVSPTTSTYNEFITRYRHVIPKAYELFAEVGALLRKYHYRSFNNRHIAHKIDEHGNTPLQLTIAIEDMRINACAPNLRDPTEAGTLDNFNVNAFDKVNAWFQIRWTISTLDNELILHTGTAEGAADDIEGLTSNIKLLAIAAFKQAVTNMMAAPEFMHFATPGPKAKKPAPMETANTPTPSEEEPGLLGNIAEKFQLSSIKKSNAAKALTMVNPLRIMITQYYAETGEWPPSFAAMNIDPKELREPKVISEVELRLGGVLHIRLAASAFGENEIMQLIPREAMGGSSMEWTCRTSLDKAYWVGDCTGL